MKKSKKYLKFLETKEELQQLTNKQLQDIGLSRNDIERVAQQKVYGE